MNSSVLPTSIIIYVFYSEEIQYGKNPPYQNACKKCDFQEKMDYIKIFITQCGIKVHNTFLINKITQKIFRYFCFSIDCLNV